MKLSEAASSNAGWAAADQEISMTSLWLPFLEQKHSAQDLSAVAARFPQLSPILEDVLAE